MAALSEARRLVVKIGSALLVDKQTGAFRGDWLHSIAEDIARIKARGTDVILVSSGSIALGRGILKLPPVALPLEQSQAAAAVGQIRLAREWEDALAPHGVVTGQVLVTLEDSADRRRYPLQLLARHGVPSRWCDCGRGDGAAVTYGDTFDLVA